MEIEKLYLPTQTCVRSGEARPRTVCTVTHFTAVPMQRAQAVYKYYANNCLKQGIAASANYIVDKDRVLEIIPPNEVSWGCGAAQYWHYTPFAKWMMAQFGLSSPNYATINIEVCYDDISGEFPAESISKLVALLKKLQKEFNLPDEYGHVRHWDITNKNCPAYYVGRSAEWDIILSRVSILNW